MRRKAAVALVLLAGIALLVVGFFLSRASRGPAELARDAYQRGDYAEAVKQYGQAGEGGEDPSAVAHNQAAALYRLGRYDNASDRYAESAAEARAEYDRGNCAFNLARGEDGRLEPARLREAVEHYRNCLDRQAAAKDSGKLADDARHNLELAKLLLAGEEGRPKPEDLRNAVAVADPKGPLDGLCPT